MFYLTYVEEGRCMKFDNCDRDRRQKPFRPKQRGYNFYKDGKCIGNLWTPTAEFTFNGDFVFANYWFAYAHIERHRPKDVKPTGS
jgi:hypothetical protein